MDICGAEFGIEEDYSNAGFIIQTPSEIWEAAHNKEDDDEEDFEDE